MKRKVERLRVVLAVGTLLLLVALVGTMGYARYRAGRAWLSRAKQRSGVTLTRETDGFTYSQSVQGKTLFTLHASKAFQHVDGQWTLHDVVLTLYGLRANRADRVYGNEFEWDETKGIARAVGEVQMDLQVPPGVASAERRGGASAATAAAGDAESVHVQTSGLVFVRELGVAATQESIEFRYGGMRCVAKGAEFDSSPSAMHLLADVHAQGLVRGEAVDLHAATADFRRDTNVLTLAQIVVDDAGRTARGREAVLQLRPDGSVERAEVTGGLELAETTAKGDHATISALRLDAVMDAKNKPQQAKLSGGVKLVDDGAKQRTRGEAKAVEVMFDAESRPSRMVATGAARLGSDSSGAGGNVSRDVRGERMLANFAVDAKRKAHVQDVMVEGQARAASLTTSGSSGGGAGQRGAATSSMTARSMQATFRTVGGRQSVDTVRGEGDAVVQQFVAGGLQRTTAADMIEVHMAAQDAGVVVNGGKGGDAIASAIEEGHVTIMSREPAKPGAKSGAAGGAEVVTHAMAEHATYDGAGEVVTLNGDARLDDAGRSMRAGSVVVHQRSGDAEADGNVVATLASATGGEATHIAAGHATFKKTTGIAEFKGGKGGRARLWQGASQVEAATITADRQQRLLVARPDAGGFVESVFAQTPGEHKGREAAGGEVKALGEPKPRGGAGYVMQVRSSELKFFDADHRALFAGPVTVNGATGKVQGESAEVFFTPVAAKVGKSDAVEGGNVLGASLGAAVLDRAVVSGAVRLEEGGRSGTGQQLTYKASDGSFVLTGTAQAPPQIVDKQQGTVTGSALLFRAGDSTIVVSGAKGVAAGTPGATGGDGAAGKPGQRARIDTRLRQKAQ